MHSSQNTIVSDLWIATNCHHRNERWTWIATGWTATEMSNSEKKKSHIDGFTTDNLAFPRKHIFLSVDAEFWAALMELTSCEHVILCHATIY